MRKSPDLHPKGDELFPITVLGVSNNNKEFHTAELQDAIVSHRLRPVYRWSLNEVFEVIKDSDLPFNVRENPTDCLFNSFSSLFRHVGQDKIAIELEEASF